MYLACQNRENSLKQIITLLTALISPKFGIKGLDQAQITRHRKKIKKLTDRGLALHRSDGLTLTSEGLETFT